MRPLNIASNKKAFALERVAKEHQFILKLAQRHALSAEELETLFAAGLKTFENLSDNNTTGKNDKILLWNIRQAILEMKEEIGK